MPAAVVVYADFESAIDDKNTHKRVMLSCLAVSRIPAIDTQLRVFHTPHKSEEELCPFMDYLTQLHESLKSYLFNEFPLENSPSIERVFRATTVCPFCHVKLDDGEIDDSMKVPKVRHHAHVAGEYTTGKEGYATSKLGSTFAPVVPSVTCSSRSTRRTIVCQSTSTMGLTTISHSS